MMPGVAETPSTPKVLVEELAIVYSKSGHLANFLVTCRDCSNTCDILGAVYLLSLAEDLFNCCI